MDAPLLQAIAAVLGLVGGFCGWLYTTLRPSRRRPKRMGDERASEAEILLLKRQLAAIIRRVVKLEKDKTTAPRRKAVGGPARTPARDIPGE